MLTAEAWRDAVAQAKTEGFTWFDVLTAHDNVGRSNEIIVTLRLINRSTGESRQIEVAVDRDAPVLDDISDLFAGAAWGQRYVHDCYGVTFSGADLRPLLIHDGNAPLRKEFILGARAVIESPASGDRRGQAAGVPDPAVWGRRDPSLPPPSAQEIIGGSGSRRRRR